MKALTILISILLLTSCESRRAANKIEWLKEKGYLSTETITDTITIRGFDTAIVRQFDTFNHTDTLIIVRNGIRTQTIIKWKDRIVTQRISQGDTVIRYQHIRTTITEPFTLPRVVKIVAWWVVLLLALTLIWRLIKKL